MRAISLHPDVLLVTSAIWQTNCVLVRAAGTDPATAGQPSPAAGAEVFVIDSPVLPEELAVLAALPEQMGFQEVSALLATHADWDHLLARLAFPDRELGCAESTAARLTSRPGDAQRELRAFDEEHYIERERPLVLGAPQALPVPGHCGIGSRELELLAAEGHTTDGMAIWIGWAGVLVAGDYLSSVELPVLGEGGSPGAYCETLRRLEPFVARSAHVVPGHGPVLDSQAALALLEQDLAYLDSLLERGPQAVLPAGRRSRVQREVHARNVASL